MTGYDPDLHVAGTWDDDLAELESLRKECASQARRIEALKWMYRKATGFIPTAQDYIDALDATKGKQ